MLIPRIHLFELEDQAWFPRVVRDLATDYLHFVERRLGLHRPAVPLLAELLRTTGIDRVLDLCSGGSGPVPELREALAEKGLDVHFTLTDFYPNIDAFEAAAARAPGAIAFVAEPVDARAVPAQLKGVRTIFNAFHHFSPDDARAILANAVAARQPIAVFEISDRRLGTLLPALVLTPLMVLITTALIRPVRFRRLFWTYLVPLVPVTCWWDGAVSQLRAYTPEELEQLARTAGASGFSWQAGRVPIGFLPGDMTYLMGWPSEPNA